MVVDAMLKSTEDRAASAIYKKILGPEAAAALEGLLGPLAEVGSCPALSAVVCYG